MLLKIGYQKKLLSERVEIFMKVWNQLRMEISNNGKLLEGCVICKMFYPKQLAVHSVFIITCFLSFEHCNDNY